MRVAMLTSAPFPPREGIGTYTFRLATELRRLGHTAVLITRGGARTPIVRRLHGLPLIRLPFLPLYPVHVHLHGPWVRSFMRRHRFDVGHAHSPLVPHPPSDLATVLTVHTPMRADTRAISLRTLRGQAIRAQGLVSERLERSLLRRSDVVAVVAESVAVELAEYGLQRSDVHVVGNAIDPDEFPAAERGDQSPTILYSGRLSDRKGLEDLLDAFRIVHGRRPDARLVLAGDGPLTATLDRKAREYGLRSQLTLTGHVAFDDRASLLKLYRSCGVYVQPSRYEGLPTSLLEAMASGAPSIATAVSGHPDVLTDGVNGLLVPPQSPEAIANAILKVMGNSSLAMRLGTSGRRTVLASHTWSNLASKYLELYELALSRRMSRSAH